MMGRRSATANETGHQLRGRWASSSSAPPTPSASTIPTSSAPTSARPASLFAAALHPGRLRSLVVGSGGAAFPLRLGSVLKDWVKAPDLDSFRNADPRQIDAGALAGIERYALPDAVREDYPPPRRATRAA